MIYENRKDHNIPRYFIYKLTESEAGHLCNILGGRGHILGSRQVKQGGHTQQSLLCDIGQIIGGDWSAICEAGVSLVRRR